jgi:hypothetical protein
MSARLPVADIKFIADFAAFCRTKGDEGYVFTDRCSCALASFLRETGREPMACVIPGYWFTDEAAYEAAIADDWRNLEGRACASVPEGIDDCLNTGECDDRTFSALADRLEALIADAPRSA